MRLTVELGVLSDSDVEESGVEPFESNADISDGVQHYLCIEVLYQVMMETTDQEHIEEKREILQFTSAAVV